MCLLFVSSEKYLNKRHYSKYVHAHKQLQEIVLKKLEKSIMLYYKSLSNYECGLCVCMHVSSLRCSQDLCRSKGRTVRKQ